MPEVMANNANGNVAAVNGQRPERDPSPELRQPGCWGKLWCLGSSRKRGMRITPVQGTGNTSNAWASNGASSSTAVNQFVGLSPSLLAPPSSPASFANSGNPSTVQSPASFTVSLCVPTANVVCSPAFDSTATMFTIGPYAHETTLVTPPAFSAFTTAPSTAPFTPPPELAHLTTPSSPDVPFAQLLASSLKNAKGGSSAPQPASASPFASPDYVSRSCEMQTTYQMYPESPLASLISPASGISESGPPSPLPELEFPAAIVASNKPTTLSMRRITSTAFELPSKRPVEISTSSTATPQSESANHSRELEPIKFLSPFMDYNDPAATTTITTTITDDDPDRRQAELSVLEEWRLLTCQGSSNSVAACLQGSSDSAVRNGCGIPTQGVACRVINKVIFCQSLSEGAEYQESSEAAAGDSPGEAVAGEGPREEAATGRNWQAPACETSTDPAATGESPGEAISGESPREAATGRSWQAPACETSTDPAACPAPSSLTPGEAASSSEQAGPDEAATSSTEANAVVSSSSETEAATVGNSTSEAAAAPSEAALTNSSGIEADDVAKPSVEAAAGQNASEAAAGEASARCSSEAAPDLDTRNLVSKRTEEESEAQQEVREGTGYPPCSKAVEPDGRCSVTSTSMLVVELTVDDVVRLQQQQYHEPGTPKNGVNGFNNRLLPNGYSAELLPVVLTKPSPDCLLLGVVHSNGEQQMKTQD